jgi:hypothetical protein
MDPVAAEKVAGRLPYPAGSNYKPLRRIPRPPPGRNLRINLRRV